MSDAEFRELITRTLTCRIDARAKCADAMEVFLTRCFYQAGAYDQCVCPHARLRVCVPALRPRGGCQLRLRFSFCASLAWVLLSLLS